MDRSISSGIGYKVNERNDYIGFAAGWKRASSETDEANNKDQYTTEVYYRFQLLPRLQITPSIEYIDNPIFSTDIGHFWIESLRLRVVF